jgi:hypothetical protein
MIAYDPDVKCYVELRVRVRAQSGHRYNVQIAGPDDQVDEGEFDLPIKREDVQQAFASVRATETVAQRSFVADALDPMRGLGALLYGRIFEGRREILYRRVLASAAESQSGVMVALDVDADDALLPVLPWEFLYDGRGFLNLSGQTPVVRRAASPTPRLAPSAVDTVHVLLATRYQVGGTSGVEAEINLLGALAGPVMQLTVLDGVSPGRLRNALSGQPYVVFHFLGEGVEVGDREQALVFAPETENVTVPDGGTGGVVPPEVVGERDLERVLGPLRGAMLRLVVLSAPTTDRLAAPVVAATGAPTVIAVRGAMSDGAHMVFMAELYRELLAGQSPLCAVWRGRQAIDRHYVGSLEWGLPVVYATGIPDPLVADVAAQAGVDVAAPSSDELGTPHPDVADEPRRAREWQILQRLRSIEETNLQALEAQKSASRGPVPADVERQIEEIRQKIEGYTAELDRP